MLCEGARGSAPEVGLAGFPEICSKCMGQRTCSHACKVVEAATLPHAALDERSGGQAAPSTLQAAVTAQQAVSLCCTMKQ